MHKVAKLVLGVCVLGFFLIWLWSGANKTHEAKQNVESSSFDTDWEKAQAHFADNKKDEDEHLAAAGAAQKDVAQAKTEYVDSKKTMDAIPDMLKDVAKESGGDLDKRIAQEEAKRK